MQKMAQYEEVLRLCDARRLTRTSGAGAAHTDLNKKSYDSVLPGTSNAIPNRSAHPLRANQAEPCTEVKQQV